MPPSASLLSLLTISSEEGEQVFFAHLKELIEIAPPQGLYWYPKKGGQHHAEYLWKAKKLKQWLLIGDDKKIAAIFESLISQNRYTKTVLGSPDIIFRLQPTVLKETSGGAVLIDGLSPCKRSNYPDLYEQKKLSTAITFLIDEISNCSFLSGYEHHSLIKPMTPAGLLSPQHLFEYLKQKVNAIRQHRDIFYSLQRRSIQKTGGKKSVRGFVQQDKSFRAEHFVEIRNPEGTRVIGRSDIQEDNGKWEVQLEEGEEEENGQFLIGIKNDFSYCCGKKYFFLKGITVTSQIVNTVIRDCFGREITLTGGDTGLVLSPIESANWNAATAPDGRQAEIELSDKIMSVLLTLGKRIRIVDPYFLGSLLEKDGKINPTSKSQLIFLNALLVTLAKGAVTSLIIQGYWTDAAEREFFKEQYKLLWKLIRTTYLHSNALRLNTLELVFTKEKFHDRYWLSDEDDNPTIYSVTNSVNGPVENEEWAIMLLKGTHCYKQRSIIHDRYSEGEKLDLTK